MIIDPPVLQATPAFGAEGADRFVVQNLVNRQIWTGNGFSPDWSDALLYADANRACGDTRRIMMRIFEGEPFKQYTAPVRVEVFGETSMLNVQQWLSRAALLKLRTDDYGNGPGNGDRCRFAADRFLLRWLRLGYCKCWNTVAVSQRSAIPAVHRERR